MEVIISVSKSEIARPISDFLLSGSTGQRWPIGQDVFEVSRCVGSVAERFDYLLEFSGFAALRGHAILVVDGSHAAGSDDSARSPAPVRCMPRDLLKDFRKLHLFSSMERHRGGCKVQVCLISFSGSRPNLFTIGTCPDAAVGVEHLRQRSVLDIDERCSEITQNLYRLTAKASAVQEGDDAQNGLTRSTAPEICVRGIGFCVRFQGGEQPFLCLSAA